MNSTQQIVSKRTGKHQFAADDQTFAEATARFGNSTRQQRLNAKDSLHTKALEDRSILFECLVQNRNSSEYNKGRMSHKSNEQKNKTEISDVCLDTRKVQPSSVNRMFKSSNSIIPTINNSYYQEVIEDDDGDEDTGRYKSAARPIHRSQQEIDLIRQEEKMTSAIEHEFHLATWRMYNRIMNHRQKRPLPDRYYDEVNQISASRSQNNIKSSTDLVPSDLTATTTGTNSTSSSPSVVVDSPKFATLLHSKSRGRVPTCVNYPADRDEHLGIITMVDEEESDDEYTDMMMFDLEL